MMAVAATRWVQILLKKNNKKLVRKILLAEKINKEIRGWRGVGIDKKII